MTRWDKYLVGFLLVLAGLGLGFNHFTIASPGALKAVISVDGKARQEIILQKSLKDKKIFLPGKCVIEAKGERIRVLKANCPDKICVKTGWIRNSGQTIICLPQRVVVSLEKVKESNIENGYDSVVY